MKNVLVPALLVILSVPAHAHVTANPDHGKAGAYFQTALRVSHGCDGSATTSVHVKIPPEIITVRPQAKPGWTIEIKTKKLEKPITSGHGKVIDEAVTDVIWSGGVLPDKHYDEFGLVMKLPEKNKVTLWFPVIQECEKGSNQWADIPKDVTQWHHAHRPAPFVKVTR